MAFDYGSTRVGVAVAHDSMVFARPAIPTSSGLAALGQLIHEEAPTRVFVGLPLLLSGGEGSAASAAIEFARALRNHVDLPVYLVDERHTTTIADATLKQLPLSGKQRRQLVDSAAAAELLHFILKTEALNPNHPWRPAIV